MAVLNSVDKFYRNIIEEVLLGCRELFLNDEVDEAVLTELKQMWERKIKQAKVFEFSNLKPANSSFNVGSYGIISSSRNVGCPEILVPSIHLTGPRGDGSNPCTPTATIALPYGLYQQQISALNSAGISLQPSGNGQFLAFLRPDQTRLQSLTVPQNRQVSGKGRLIGVSTPSVTPVRPKLANLNPNPNPNRVPTTSVTTKTVSELNKQINVTVQGAVVNNCPNGNIAVKVTENTCPQPPLNINKNNGGSSVNNASNSLNGSNSIASTNIKIVENANSKINTSNPYTDNTVTSNIKDIPNNSTTNSSCINTVKGLPSYTNNTPNPAVNNTCNIAVSTNTTVATFNTAQNTQPLLNTSSTNANSSYNTRIYNNEAYYNNQPQLNNYGNQPINNNSYPGLYDDRVYQTGTAFGVPNQPESLDDFMDNLCDSNNGASYGYINPQPSQMNADRNITTDFDSAVNTIGNLITGHSTSDVYNNNNNFLFGSASSSNYKRDPLDGEMMHGHARQFSEADMQTIDEILQLDGTGDEHEFKNAPKSILQQQGMLRRFPTEHQPNAKKLTACKIKNPQICNAKPENIYQNTNASRKAQNFNDRTYFLAEQSPFKRLEMRNILKRHSLREDYVLNNPNHLREGYVLNNPNHLREDYVLNKPNYLREGYVLNKPNHLREGYVLNNPNHSREDYVLNNPNHSREGYVLNNPNHLREDYVLNNPNHSREGYVLNNPNHSREDYVLNKPNHLREGYVLNKPNHLREDYVLNKPNHSTEDRLVLSMLTNSTVLDFNSTLNKNGKEYNLKTKIQRFGSLFNNKKSHFCARSVSKASAIFALNRFENLPNVTKDKPLGPTFGYSSPDSNSSTNSVRDPRRSVLIIKDAPPFIRDPSSSKPGTMVSKKSEQLEACREFGPLLRAPIRHQFDGEDAGSSSSSDDNINTNDAPSDDNEDEDEDDDECEEATEEVEDVAIESDPLNSADDDSDIDICAMFESDNIIVCQFEKISRNKNKWKFHLKDGIMNLYGRDLIFSKSVGEAEW